MSPQLRMLLWKEWRERRLLFLLCLLWMVGSIAYDVVHEWPRWSGGLVSHFSSQYVFGLFMPIFVAMRTSLGETTDRTRSFMSALPISGQRCAWIRLGGGLAVLLTPILVWTAIQSLALAAGWTAMPELRWGGTMSVHSAFALIGHRTAVEISSVTSLYLLLSLLGTALRTEAHAGYLGAAVTILWLLGQNVVPHLHYSVPEEIAVWVDAAFPRAMMMNAFYGSDGGMHGELKMLCAMLFPLMLHVILQLVMAEWFVRRYGRKSPGRIVETVHKTPTLLFRPWSVAFPNPSAALAWLTLRQSLPMCLPGLAIACLMTPLLALGRFRHSDPWEALFAEGLPISMLLVGIVWSVVVGAGVFAAEIDWRVGEFWRTRPIPFWRFFAVKFFVGLFAVLLVLDVMTIAVSWSLSNWMHVKYFSLNWPYLACVVPLHSVMFAVAVAWTCALRRPVLGGAAAIATFAFIEVVIYHLGDAARFLEPTVVYEHMRNRGLAFVDIERRLIFAAAMIVIFLLAAILAGIALRRYDPRRQSG